VGVPQRPSPRCPAGSLHRARVSLALVTIFTRQDGGFEFPIQVVTPQIGTPSASQDSMKRTKQRAHARRFRISSRR
jgi:hypothetical protein